MDWQGSLIPLFWILSVSFLFQLMVSRLPFIRIPGIISYIIFGIIIGNLNLEIFQDFKIDWLNGMGNLGLFFLMFMSGLEIDLSLLKTSKIKSNKMKDKKESIHPLLFGIVFMIFTFSLSFVFSIMMNHLDNRIQPWMMMLILSTTSLGVVLPVLKERGIIQTKYGQSLLIATILADFITMCFISIAADIVQNGYKWTQFSVGLLLPASFLFYLLICRFYRTRFWDRWFRNDMTAKMKAVFATMGIFGIIADLTGSEQVLGSFLAGVLFSTFELKENNHLRQQIEVIGDSFIIPIFFVMVGMNFRFNTFLGSREAISWIPFLISAAYFVKIVPALWVGRSFGAKESLAGGILLSSRMTLVIVASSIGIRLGVIPPVINQAMLIVAMITCTLSPIFFNFINRYRIDLQ